MANIYYSDNLAAEWLKRCYDIAPPRVRQYLRAEVNFVLDRVRPGDAVLDLGCGYGRAIPQLAQKAGLVVGIDTSLSSLKFGLSFLHGVRNCLLLKMDAGGMSFFDGSFDAVVCIQNGISAFQVDPFQLVSESIRVARENGIVFFSTYSEKFWQHRLEWFRLQAAEGLLGEIDEEKTGDGMIVCKDGFRATTFSPEQFLPLTSKFDVDVNIVEVDESSLFCLIRKKRTRLDIPAGPI
jgi:2-polyprenyl-6-hydroxyphenyl methylase/3-demethylubiquinone-9 3-methyltransferase